MVSNERFYVARLPSEGRLVFRARSPRQTKAQSKVRARFADQTLGSQRVAYMLSKSPFEAQNYEKIREFFGIQLVMIFIAIKF